MKRFSASILALLLIFCFFPCRSQAETGGRLIALTFDDGPGEPTARLLDGLQDRGVKVTFFMLGSCAENYPDLVSRAYREGHQIASHSYSHAKMDNLTDTQIADEFRTAAEALKRASGGASDFAARLPYGNGDEHVRSLTGAPVIGWTVDPMDWKYRNAETVRNNIVSAAFDGAVVLVHDIHPTSVDGALLAIDDLKGAGYEFVTVRELFRRRGVTLWAGGLYNSCRSNGIDAGPVQTPVITGKEEGGRYLVSISAGEGAGIYYTTNGCDPLYAGNWYTGPFTAEGEVTVRAIAAYSLNGSRSEESSVTFSVPRAPTPQISAENGKAVLSVSDPAFTVRYTIESKDTPSVSGTYTAALDLAPDTVIRAYCTRDGWFDSAEVYGWYSGRGIFYRDVRPDQWFAEAADRATAEGWFFGTGDGHFSPDEALTRIQTVYLLYRFAGSVAPGSSHPFADIGEDRALSWAYENGIITGRSRDRFAPDEPVTRQEIAVILTRYFGKGSLKAETDFMDGQTEFTDGNEIAPWAEEAVAGMKDLGLLTGDEQGRFRPEANCSRAEMASILSRADDLSKKNGS
jgi:peptidoglycan/xylan/chitin deacetylase (PgdA/CDA1 family)